MDLVIALALNVGSSSLKAALFDDSDEIDRITVDEPADVRDWLESESHPEPRVIGHRLVHGGLEFSEAVRIEQETIERLRALIPLAPLHMPLALDVIAESQKHFPGAQQVACFDTAFHSTLPRVAYDLSVPKTLGIRRFGFHGINCEHIVTSLPEARTGKAVIAHLGNGSSITAVLDGKSIDTTMGFTPDGGIPMGTRSGDIDPGALIHLLRQGSTVDEVQRIVEHESGLTGWSGGKSAMRELLASSDEDSRFAVDAFCTHVAKAVARMTVSLGGLDALIFTGGIGEHAEPVRRRVTELLTHLARFDSFVVPADEERVIALHAARVATS